MAQTYPPPLPCESNNSKRPLHLRVMRVILESTISNSIMMVQMVHLQAKYLQGLKLH